jgi:O-antigen/teichoic acid export membrane protein
MRVKKNAAWLLSKDLITILTKTVSMFFLVKILGAQNFGVYSVIYGVFLFSCSFSQYGVNIFIIRKDARVNLLYTCTVFSYVISILTFIFSFIFSSYLTKDILLSFLMMLNTLIFGVRMVPLCLLEKELKFKWLSKNDSLWQIIFSLLSIPLTYYFGLVGLAASNIIYQLGVTVSTYKVVPVYTGKFCRIIFMDILKFGSIYTFSCIGLQTKNLINTFLSMVLPMSSVGVISLMNKILDNVVLIKETIRRLSISVINNLQNDAPKLKIFVEKVIFIQSSITGIMLIFLFLVYPILIKFLGSSWSITPKLLAYTSISILFGSFITVQNALMLIKDNNFFTGLYYYSLYGIIIIGTLFLCPIMGPMGFAYSSLSSIVVTIIPFFGVKKLSIVPINYAPSIVVVTICSLILFILGNSEIRENIKYLF